MQDGDDDDDDDEDDGDGGNGIVMTCVCALSLSLPSLSLRREGNVRVQWNATKRVFGPRSLSKAVFAYENFGYWLICGD